MEGSLLPRLTLQSLSLFLQQVTLRMVQSTLVVATVSFGPLCWIRTVSVTVSTSTSIQAISICTTTAVTMGCPCGVCLVKKKIMINEELELKLNTSFDLPLDEIICNDEDYDWWNDLEEWEQVNIHNSQNRFF